MSADLKAAVVNTSGPPGTAAASLAQQPDQYKGWLYKWTNYIRGYQKRWFVLQNGLLSYYRNQAEMLHTCRGTINLANAFIHTGDSCSFVISNGGTQTFHLKASSEVERQRWVTALELSKARAVNLLESDDDDDIHEQPEKYELNSHLRTLNAKLNDLNTCNDLIIKHGSTLQRSLSDLEQLDNLADVTAKIKSINERATVFRITTTAMLKACNDYLEMASGQGKHWQRMLQYEHEQRLRLEELVEQLGKQHSSLERQVRKSLSNVVNQKGKRMNPQQAVSTTATGCNQTSSDEDEFFFDALNEQTEEFKVCLPPDKTKSHQRSYSGISVDSMIPVDPRSDNYDSSESESDKNEMEASVLAHKHKKDRKFCANRQVSQSGRFPVNLGKGDVHGAMGNVHLKRERRKVIPEKPNYSLNLWSIMKNCIGKELSKIPMPVNFSEPLSFLQRLTEDFEYSDCLDKAAAADDVYEQMAYVAAFTVSSYSTTTTRTLKPFNPLLGETFECDRMDDFGWRSIAEQVSHHPPVVAMYTESKDWTSWQEFTMSSKFRGKYLQIIPLGIAHLVFNKSGNHYTWRKVTTTVHNIIVGRLWVDNHGEMDITNHITGDRCHLKYTPYSYFSRDAPRKVTGVITDSHDKAMYVLSGNWDDKLEGARVLNTVKTGKGNVVYETGETKVLWQRRYPPPELERCYNFTQLAVELNEPEPDVAPTDSRNRPDQRRMEEGKWDEANSVKVLIEEKQRTARKKMEQEAIKAASQGQDVTGYVPKWFQQLEDQQTGGVIHAFTGEYWHCKEKRDWSRCPDIYLEQH